MTQSLLHTFATSGAFPYETHMDLDRRIRHRDYGQACASDMLGDPAQ